MIVQAHTTDSTAQALLGAAKAVHALLKAVGTAAPESAIRPLIDSAIKHGSVAIEAAVVDEDWGTSLDDPTTRRSRCAYAGWLMLLEGTADANCKSPQGLADLCMAAGLLKRAAKASRR